MTKTTISVFQEAVERGLKLQSVGDKLHVDFAKRCPQDFVDVLRQYKPRLIALLELPFCMVFSEAIGEGFFFCEDEYARGKLVEAGADRFAIYTRGELRVLVAQNRIAPLTAAELRHIHDTKRTFNGRIAE